MGTYPEGRRKPLTGRVGESGLVGFAFKMILPRGTKVRGAARSGAGRPAGGLSPWVQLEPQVGSLSREGQILGRRLLQREQALLQAALQGDRRR